MSGRLSAVLERRISRILASQPDASLTPGVGVDIVEVDLFREKLSERSDLLSGLFTAAELDYARSMKRPWLHLAARFAAKEALLKALGTGLTDGLSWLDMEVTRDEAGETGLLLSGGARAFAERQRVGRALLSLAHGRDYAIAVVVLIPGP
jgi:holo-[acyl-carrier protein] synthase